VLPPYLSGGYNKIAAEKIIRRHEPVLPGGTELGAGGAPGGLDARGAAWLAGAAVALNVLLQ
jgi:hypothetical protein